jgi:hypothetical protein
MDGGSGYLTISQQYIMGVMVERRRLLYCLPTV